MAITLAEIRTQAKSEADMTNSSFVADSEWLGFINNSIADLHDLLVGVYEDYYISNHTFTTVSGTADYTMPADFYKLKAVDAKINGHEWYNVAKYSFEHRNAIVDASCPRYRLRGSKLNLNPTPTSAIDFQIYYTPVATKLSLDADELDDLNQYSEYVVVSAAIKALMKEESDPSALMARLASLRARILSMAQTRDENESESVTDVTGTLGYEW